MPYFPEAGAIALYLIGVNAVAYGAFAFDKRAAQLQGRRISEATLLLFALLGGSAGALSAMHLRRHKTRKPLFSIGVPVILTAQIFLAACYIATGRAPFDLFG